jgi:transposase
MGRSAALRQTAAEPFMEAPMLKTNDLSRSVTPFKQGNTLIAVIEMSLSSRLVAGMVPGMARHPLKKRNVDPDALLRLLHRWREEAIEAGCAIERIVIACSRRSS